MTDTDINALAGRYQDLLGQDERKVSKPAEDDAGNLEITVTTNDLGVLVLLAKNDAEYVRIVLPNFYALDLDEDKINALVAMNHVNTLCKVAKVNLTEKQDNVVACVEYLDHGSAVTKPQLDRYLVLLVHTGREFAKKMQALKGADEALAA